MEYSALRKILCNAAINGKTVEAFVTFTPASFGFDKEYSKRARTYTFTSREKAFNPNVGGYSIFGSSLDGSDNGVRLESYMKDEKGGPDGWKVQTCGIIKYMLTYVYERSLSVIGYFDTQEDANRAMWLDMAKAVECEPDELADYIEEDKENCEFGPMSSWLNKRGNSDWTIIPIFMDGEKVVVLDD